MAMGDKSGCEFYLYRTLLALQLIFGNATKANCWCIVHHWVEHRLDISHSPVYQIRLTRATAHVGCGLVNW